MKRTCKTCAERDRYRRCLLPTTTAKDCYRPDDYPACEQWNLAFEDLTSAMYASVDKAREKHPVLLDVWPGPEEAEFYVRSAKFWKEEIARKEFDQLRSVIYSEVNEFIAEVARGDFDRALDEAGDIMAVLYRALNDEGKEVHDE